MTWSLIGGALIGLSATWAWLGAGQVAGISGIFGGFVRDPQRGFRAWFLAGLLLTSVVIGWTAPPALSLPARPVLWIVLAGLLVGFGTQLGSGCTSGHGVCGISRLSKRSLAATLVFVTMAAATLYASRHALAPGWVLP